MPGHAARVGEGATVTAYVVRRMAHRGRVTYYSTRHAVAVGTFERSLCGRDPVYGWEQQPCPGIATQATVTCPECRQRLAAPGREG